MAKRRPTDAELREIVRSRATKGMAFMNVDYEAVQSEWRAKLQAMDRAEIFETFPTYVYDLRP